MIGTRGIPNIPGGVEKHCQELYPRIANKGHEVNLCARKSYIKNKIDQWQGVKIHVCYAPRKKSLEAITHTFIALLKARWHSPDILHIHAIGPSLLTPIARLLRLKVVCTNHGPDYKRQKWGRLAKTILRLGEKMGGLFANEVIVISTIIEDIIYKRCNRKSNLIYNGVNLPNKSTNTDFLTQIGIEPNRYIMNVTRFVPEKGLHDLIKAYMMMKTDYKLVIVGDADHETDYSRHLRMLASNDKRIILTGYLTGNPLSQIYSYASLFILPSYHEGLPIVLLEALSYDIPVLISDIGANLAVELPSERYFRCGDVEDLKSKMQIFLKQELRVEEQQNNRKLLETKYSWDKIAEQTIEIYMNVINNNKM